jgi:dihydrofolate reductase
VRRVRYAVASSLDGFIAGPNGEADWIVHNPEVDFAELFSQFDTALIGRKTFDFMAKAGRTSMPGMKIFVFSRAINQKQYPEVTVVAEKAKETVAQLRKEDGKDIWLFGGGELFSSLACEGLVDTVELSVMPVLLGRGLSLALKLPRRLNLTLTKEKQYKNGIVSLEYAIQ